MKNELNNSKHKWIEETKRQFASGHYPKYPNEIMLKMLFGGSNYLEKPFRPQSSWRVLDVGCLFANNLLPFVELDCDCHGVDIHEEIAYLVQDEMKKRGYKMNLKAGANRNLPYPDEHFDLVLSINTLHYESNHENVHLALK